LYDGQWSRGHALWGNYPDIARDLCIRTDEILVQKKLIEPKPEKDKEKDKDEKKGQDGGAQPVGAKPAGPAKMDAQGNDLKDDYNDNDDEEVDENDDFLDEKVEGGKVIIPDDPFEGVLLPQFSDGEEEPDNLSLNMRRKVKNKVESVHIIIMEISFYCLSCKLFQLLA
jgi:hypothetical protein